MSINLFSDDDDFEDIRDLLFEYKENGNDDETLLPMFGGHAVVKTDVQKPREDLLLRGLQAPAKDPYEEGMFKHKKTDLKNSVVQCDNFSFFGMKQKVYKVPTYSSLEDNIAERNKLLAMSMGENEHKEVKRTKGKKMIIVDEEYDSDSGDSVVSQESEDEDEGVECIEQAVEFIPSKIVSQQKDITLLSDDDDDHLEKNLLSPNAARPEARPPANILEVPLPPPRKIKKCITLSRKNENDCITSEDDIPSPRRRLRPKKPVTYRV